MDRLSCVRFASARYSVPVRLIGAEVRLYTVDGRLLVIMTGAGQVVAEHVLVPPGEASVRDEHLKCQSSVHPSGTPVSAPILSDHLAVSKMTAWRRPSRLRTLGRR